MRFLDRIEVLDRIEGDKLAVVVVELHVGPRRPCDALDKQIRYLLCSAKFEGSPMSRSTHVMYSPRSHKLVLATN